VFALDIGLPKSGCLSLGGWTGLLDSLLSSQASLSSRTGLLGSLLNSQASLLSSQVSLSGRIGLLKSLLKLNSQACVVKVAVCIAIPGVSAVRVFSIAGVFAGVFSIVFSIADV
jgi:hypothetical protein